MNPPAALPLIVASSSAAPSLNTLSVASEICDRLRHAAVVAGGRVDDVARRLRQRDLRRRILFATLVAAGEARIDLEVDVRPASGVAAGEDRRERDLPARVGRLHAAQVVLVGRRPTSRASSGRARSQCQRYTARPASGAQVDADTIVSTIVSGTPSAVPFRPAKLERMSLRTTPVELSTFGPFEPSPGNGPCVSSGILAVHVADARTRSACAARAASPTSLGLVGLPIRTRAAAVRRRRRRIAPRTGAAPAGPSPPGSPRGRAAGRQSRRDRREACLSSWAPHPGRASSPARSSIRGWGRRECGKTSKNHGNAATFRTWRTAPAADAGQPAGLAFDEGTTLQPTSRPGAGGVQSHMRIRQTLAALTTAVTLLSLAPMALAQDVPAGRRTFEARCGRCHGADGRGGEMGPPIAQRIGPLDDEQLAKVIHDGIPAKGMPPNVLEGPESVSLIAFLRTLARSASEAPIVRLSVSTTAGAVLAGQVMGRGLRGPAAADGRQARAPAAPLRRPLPRGLVRDAVAHLQRRPGGNRYTTLTQIDKKTVRPAGAALDVHRPGRRQPAGHADGRRRHDVRDRAERVLRARRRQRTADLALQAAAHEGHRPAAAPIAASASPAIASSW